MKKINTLIFLILFTLLSGCSFGGKTKKEQPQIAAVVGTEIIDMTEVDKTIVQELYDELNRIYAIRRIALQELVKDRVLMLEASKKDVSVSELLDDYYSKRINEQTIEQYMIINGNTESIGVLKNGFEIHDVSSDYGQKILEKRMKDSLLEELVDSLKNVFQVQIHLEPPVVREIDTKELNIHYKGNLESKVTVVEISDFECDRCREYKPLFDQLFEKYQKTVRFGFSNFGSYVSVSALAVESAANQGKYWEMHEALFREDMIPDTTTVFNLAQRLNLDITLFENDFNSLEINSKVDSNLHTIASTGVYATPTITVNGKLVNNSSSIAEISALIDKELAKVK